MPMQRLSYNSGVAAKIDSPTARRNGFSPESSSRMITSTKIESPTARRNLFLPAKRTSIPSSIPTIAELVTQKLAIGFEGVAKAFRALLR